MFKSIIAISLVAMLTGCGGGSSSTPDNSKAITDAAKAIAEKYPAKPFTGAFTLINGIANGYTYGASEQLVVDSLARTIANAPASFPELYKLLLSDAGLKITIVGEAIGKGTVSGLPVYAPDVVYTVALLADGLHVS